MNKKIALAFTLLVMVLSGCESNNEAVPYCVGGEPGYCNENQQIETVTNFPNCEEIAKLDWDMINPTCYQNGGACSCKNRAFNSCIDWDIKNNSKRCNKYKYTEEEFEKMSKEWVVFYLR